MVQRFKRRFLSLSKFLVPEPPLQVICPSSERIPGLFELIKLLLENGIRWIQYRGKETPRKIQYSDCLEIKRLAVGYGAIFIVNDFVDLALAVDADGVHIGQEDIPLRMAKSLMPSKIIGVSTHSLEEALEADSGGATYIGYGPIFFTKTKDAGTPKGPSGIKIIKEYVKIPVVAIGGIKAENADTVSKNGADAIAVSSGIIEGDVRENIKNFLKAIKGARS